LSFAPKENQPKKQFLESFERYLGGSVLFYESPNRILDTLAAMNELYPDLTITLGRELTKAHEEIIRGKPVTLIEHLQKHSYKGEFVVMISMPKNHAPQNEHKWLEDKIHDFVKQGKKTKEILALVEGMELNKKEIYNLILKLKDNN
jgi:16S rRNA (cytidine1402-2'-O)-methyltransferase